MHIYFINCRFESFFFEDPQALLAAINDPVVVAGYESDGNLHDALPIYYNARNAV